MEGDNFDLRVSMRFEQISREADVQTFTGLPSTKLFKFLFKHLFERVQHLQ